MLLFQHARPAGNGNFFNGTIDEVKIFNIALTQNEVNDLYYNNLRFRELSFYISNWNPTLDTAKIFVKVPYVKPSSNVNIRSIQRGFIFFVWIHFLSNLMY